MNESRLPTRARVMLEDFEMAFSDAWNAAQDILLYIDNNYDGDRCAFLDDALHDCDYYSIAQALNAVFDFSEK